MLNRRQLDLFAVDQTDSREPHCQFDQQKRFAESHPTEWRKREYERALEFVRASLPVILEGLRSAETFPWLPRELRALRIIFHNRSSWLPTEECVTFRKAFCDELARWERHGQLPSHEDIDPALLTRRTKPPTLDCPIAEWEIAGIPPLAEDDGTYGRSHPLPLDQDTYILWPGVFRPRTMAPPPSKERMNPM